MIGIAVIVIVLTLLILFFDSKRVDNNLTLTVREPWFSYIKSKKKTIESRVGPATKYSRFVGNKVIFKNRHNTHVANIIDVRHYPDLVTYLSAENYKLITPNARSMEESKTIHNNIYSDNAIRDQGGINAIVLA